MYVSRKGTRESKPASHALYTTSMPCNAMTIRHDTTRRRRARTHTRTSLAFLPYSAMAFSTSAKPVPLFRERGRVQRRKGAVC